MRTLKLFLGWNYGSHKNNGAVTIEASIVLPLFICVALSIAFFIKVVYTHEIIQHALNQTANEISQLSYIYHASGVKSIEEEIFQNIGNEVGELEDIPEELRDMLYSVIKGIYEDDFNRLCSTLTKIYMGKYFTDGEIKDPDKKLKKLNIDDGMNGLDMSMSSFFVDDKNDIDMIVRYKIDIPVPIKIFPPLHFVQRATVKAWLFGDEIINDNEEDIWSLDNFTRGRKIRKMFGANLPFNYNFYTSYLLFFLFMFIYVFAFYLFLYLSIFLIPISLISPVSLISLISYVFRISHVSLLFLPFLITYHGFKTRKNFSKTRIIGLQFFSSFYKEIYITDKLSRFKNSRFSCNGFFAEAISFNASFIKSIFHR
jgi:hypothetical protein